METDAEQTKPYWVVFISVRQFVAGHDTRATAEAHARDLNPKAPAPPGQPPYYRVMPQPQSAE